MPELYFENVKTGTRFKVVSWDKETNAIILKGPNTEFTETFDKDKFKKMGYKPVQVETPATEDNEDAE